MTDPTIFLALGANVGDQEGQILKAIELMTPHITQITKAPFYHSKPMGVTDQPDFVNTAITGTTALAPEALLSFVKELEKKIGRIYRYRWGPREIDIDIIFYDDLIFKSSDLEIPHAHAHERDFVLRPIVDLDPTFVHPVLHKRVDELLSDLLPEFKVIMD